MVKAVQSERNRNEQPVSMKTLKASMMMIALALISQVVMAQPEKRDPQEMAKKQTQKMTEVIDGLSTDQIAQLEAVNLKYTQKRQAIFEEHRGEREQMRTEMREMGKEKKAEMDQILNEDQQAQLKEHMKAQREARKEKRGHRQHRTVPADLEK